MIETTVYLRTAVFFGIGVRMLLSCTHPMLKTGGLQIALTIGSILLFGILLGVMEGISVKLNLSPNTRVRGVFNDLGGHVRIHFRGGREGMTVTQELIGFSAMASLWTLGIIRVRNMLWGLAFVGAALGILPLHDGIEHGNPSEIWLGCAVIAIKAIGVPLFLNWNALRTIWSATEQ